MKRALIALAFVATTAHAGTFKNGNTLLSDMNSQSATRAIALGYVIGVVDALDNVIFCVPSGATAGQAHDMVQNYLESNPAIRHLPAHNIISHALKTVWPCAARPSGRGV